MGRTAAHGRHGGLGEGPGGEGTHDGEQTDDRLRHVRPSGRPLSVGEFKFPPFDFKNDRQQIMHLSVCAEGGPLRCWDRERPTTDLSVGAAWGVPGRRGWSQGTLGGDQSVAVWRSGAWGWVVGGVMPRRRGRRLCGAAPRSYFGGGPGRHGGGVLHFRAARHPTAGGGASFCHENGLTTPRRGAAKRSQRRKSAKGTRKAPKAPDVRKQTETVVRQMSFSFHLCESGIELTSPHPPSQTKPRPQTLPEPLC